MSSSHGGPIRVSRRGQLQGSAAALGGLLLAACGQGTGTGEAPAPPDARRPAKIGFAYRSGYDLVFNQFPAAFQKQAPHVTVTPESVTGNYEEKILAYFAAGTPPDLSWAAGIGSYFDYALRGEWLAIEPYLSRDKLDRSQWFPGALEMLRVNGKLYALPLWSHPSQVALYYNTTTFQREGMAPPDGTWTFEKTVDVAKRLTRETGSPETSMYGYQPPWLFLNGVSQMVRAMGGRAFSADGKKLQLLSDQGVAAVQWITDMLYRHRSAVQPGSRPSDSAYYNADWLAGRLAMRVELYGTRRTARDPANPWPVQWSANLTPKGPGGNGAELQTDCVPIAKQTREPNACWEFQRFLAGNDIGMMLVRGNYLPGARPDVWNHPDLAKDATHTPFIAVMQSAPPIDHPVNFRLLELDTTLRAQLAKIASGAVAVRDGLTEAQRLGQLVVDKPPLGQG